MSRRLLLLIEGALAVALVLGVSGFTRSDQDVALSIDGAVQNVETRAATVAELLDERGVEVSDRDLVIPDPTTPVADVDEVTVRHARPIEVVIDGQPTRLWTTELTIEAALAQVGVRLGDAEVTASRSDRVPLGGARVGVRMPDQVTVLHDQTRTTVVTTAATVAEVLKEAGVRLDKHDRVNVGLRHRVETGLQVEVTRVTTAVRRDRYRIPFSVVRRADSDRYEGYENVVRSGRAGIGLRQTRIVKHDGVVVRRQEIDRRTLREPVKRIVVYGTKPRPYSAPATSADGLNWAALAQCESGGNPRAVNPAGYYGLYQFSLSTWASVGGTGNPIDASAEEQTYRAKVLYQRSGASPWPVCGPLLFS
ncbi:MAG TPA: ubiquitin-like domain-containing protein [Actinomycetes bacterium]|nr:ubiquitin-like domain-containing protein [Actinomycetes bacterium]